MLKKHWKKIAIAAVILLAAVITVTVVRSLLDDSFYVRSDRHQGDSTVDEVIDLYAEHSEYNVIADPQVTFSMGLGGFAMEDYEVFVTVDAPDCKINGVADEYRKDYPDFYEEKYRVEYENFSSKVNARYHEDLVIEFPDNRRAGTVVLKLHIKSERANVDLTRELEFQYTIRNGVVSLIAEE